MAVVWIPAFSEHDSQCGDTFPEWMDIPNIITINSRGRGVYVSRMSRDFN